MPCSGHVGGRRGAAVGRLAARRKEEATSLAEGYLRLAQILAAAETDR
jgi:hypothetical protein